MTVYLVWYETCDTPTGRPAEVLDGVYSTKEAAWERRDMLRRPMDDVVWITEEEVIDRM